MRINAPLRRFLLAALIIGQTALLLIASPADARAQEPQATPAAASQRLVESVDIQGNRRNRDEDLLYYVTTRAGDNFSEAQAARDLKALNDLNFFNKTKSRVLTLDGPRGGVEVIFEVEELPIIRDLQFEVCRASPIRSPKAFRERPSASRKRTSATPLNSTTHAA